MEHRVFQREPLEGAWSVDESSGAASALDRIYFEKDDVGFIRVAKKLVPFHKHFEGGQLRLSIAGDDDMVHEGSSPPTMGTLRRIAAAGAAGFPHILRGAVISEGETIRFDGTCDDQPCAMKLTREFPK